MQSRLSLLVTRCSMPGVVKSNADAVDCLKGLLGVRNATSSRTDRGLVQAVNLSFVKLCRRDSTVIADVLQGLPIDVSRAEDGRAASLLALSLPKVECDEVLWEQVVKLCEAGIAAAVWEPQDVRHMSSQIVQWGAYPATLVAAVERYVIGRVAHCGEKELPFHVLILASFNELRRSPALAAVATRTCQIPHLLSIQAISSLALGFTRTQFTSKELLDALQGQGIRFAEDCDVYGAIGLFCFLVMHHETATVDLDTLRCLMERIVNSDEHIDANTTVMLSRHLRQLPKAWLNLAAGDVAEMVAFVSREVHGLVEAPQSEGGLKGEQNLDQVQNFLSRYLSMVAALQSDRVVPVDDVTMALRACAEYIEDLAEDFVSSENPPFSLIPHLLDCSEPQVRLSAVAIMREAALQHISYPTVQMFRFLLALGDHRLADKKVFRHLQNQFCQTLKGIPMIQLCAALKCFVTGLEVNSSQPSGVDVEGVEGELLSQAQRELQEEELMAFLVQCEETINCGLSEGMDVRCLLSLVSSMHLLGYKTASFFDKCFAYLATKVSNASPSIHSVNDAEIVKKAFGPERLGGNVNVAQFLDKVLAEGSMDGHMSPSKWMNDNDPANHITPLTEEQQKGWDILNEMRYKTRSADTEALSKLAEKYMSMLKLHRPDDLKAFFHVFEEKVFKNDKLLKQCLEHLCDLNIIKKLSGHTIAAILHSLAGIRFTYYGTVKKFMLAVSEEQWSGIEANALVHIVSGMSKLSLRSPGVLLQLSERLVQVCNFLTPMDTAMLVNSLQSLGFHDDAVLSMLMQQASKSAFRFDEASLTVLFNSSSIHRLMNSPDACLPLLEKAAGCSLSAGTKQKIVTSMKRSSLPREFIQSSASRVAPELTSGSAAKPLQLEG